MRNFVILLSGLIWSLVAVADDALLSSPVSVPAPAVIEKAPQSFADIVEPLIPAVVNVYTVKYSKKNSHSDKSHFSENFLFDQFNSFFDQFNAPFGFDDSYSDPKAVSLGSGFIIDSEGFIVTNHHVVSNADEINVKTVDNTELPAKLIGSDPRTDLALLKVEPKSPLPFVKFGDSSKSRVGDWVIAIGNPFGLGGTVTTGIISSKGRDLSMNPNDIVDDFIQTDAAINSGNSGGPMFNINGEVLGVNAAIFSPSGTNVGIGFSIPSNTARHIVEQLKAQGKISRGRLDITIQEVTTEIAEGLGLKELTGVLVIDVLQGGSADKAGIKSGDIITEFASQPIKNSRKLQISVAETPVNQDVKTKILRNGKTMELTVKILDSDVSGKTTSATGGVTHSNGAAILEKNGVTFCNLTDSLRQKFGIKDDTSSGIVVTDLNKNHKEYGLQVGDIITAVNQQRIVTVEQMKKIYEEAKLAKKQNVVLFVKRRSVNLFVAFPVT